MNLLYLPPLPAKSLPPFHERDLLAIRIRQLHIPTANGMALFRAMDMMLRQGYIQRNPSQALTWRHIYDREARLPPQLPLSASVIGISGVGKTIAVDRALAQYPQVVVHENFPHFIDPVKQLVWLKVDVPASGKASDLAQALMDATDMALGTEYFSSNTSRSRRGGVAMLNEWLKKIACHFPGILVLDEINNLFKLETLAEQRKGAKTQETTPLRIADDEALKFILNLTNSARIPLLVCGTPDCLPIFTTRGSTAQRLVSCGFFRFSHFESEMDHYYRETLLPKLFEYQWFDRRLPMSDELASLIHRLSGGLPRICVGLWYHAHVAAFAREADQLDYKDFELVANTVLAPIAPAVQALLSNDPKKLERYRDLIPNFDPVWGS